MNTEYERCADVEVLLDKLIATKVGEIITYKDLTISIGRDVTVYRYLLSSARRIALRDNQIVFKAILETGLQRLDDVQIVEYCSENRRKRTRNQVKLGAAELGSVEYAVLPDDKKIKHNISLAIFGSIILCTEKRQVAKLHKVVGNTLPNLVSDV